MILIATINSEFVGANNFAITGNGLLLNNNSINFTLVTNNSDLVLLNSAGCWVNYWFNGINQGILSPNNLLTVPGIVTTTVITVGFSCVGSANLAETCVSIPAADLGGSFVFAGCYGNLTTLNATNSSISYTPDVYCQTLIEETFTPTLIKGTVSRASPTIFIVNCPLENVILPTAACVSLNVSTSYIPPFTDIFAPIPGDIIFYTPTLWNEIQLQTDLFCSGSFYSAYGQFNIVNYYAFNYSINGTPFLTNWTMPVPQAPVFVNFVIPLNGSYSYVPQTLFIYYSLLQRTTNGDITTVYYNGNLGQLPTQFFINATCPVIAPTRPPGGINFPWWAWLLTIGGSAIIGGVFAFAIITVAKWYKAGHDYEETQRLVN